MAKKDIFSVACKVIGIYCLVRAVEALVALVEPAASTFRPGPADLFTLMGLLYMMIALIPVILLIAGGIYLIRRGDLIAARLAGADEAAVAGGIERDTLQEVALTTAGIVILAQVLPRIPQIAAYFSYAYRQSRAGVRGSFAFNAWGSLSGFIIHLLIGFYLVFGSRSLARWIKKRCRAGK